MPAPDRISLGRSGENAACDELRRRGYDPTLVFVEVKARTTARCGHPAEAITLHKQAKVAAMASDYLARLRARGDVPCRFDVVAVHLGEGGEVLSVEITQNAFDAPGWR
ncbi:MAG: YraN family protein [Acidobacteria bacterium]|nr:YraN family protein [Acidobacteriota bacterium]